jgi:hypothetical protein
MKHLKPPVGVLSIPTKLISQYVLYLPSSSESSWKTILLSPHPSALHFDDANHTTVLGVNVCHKCYSALSNDKMPKFAIANGFYMGRADDPRLGFPEDITPQEWRIVSPVIRRMDVRRVWGVDQGTSARNGFRGQGVSCDSAVAELLQTATSLPAVAFANMYLHVTGFLTTKQIFDAKNAVIVRRQVVSKHVLFAQVYNPTTSTTHRNLLVPKYCCRRYLCKNV